MVSLTTDRYRDYMEMERYPEEDITTMIIKESEKEEKLNKILKNKENYKLGNTGDKEFDEHIAKLVAMKKFNAR